MKKVMSMIMMSIMAFMVALTIGCGTLKDITKGNIALELGMKAAVVELIEKEGIDAVDVLDTAKAAEQYLSKNPSTKAADIIAFARTQISWDKLTVSQTILAEAVLIGVEQKIAADLERGLIDEDTKASVREVITWIIEAAELVVKRS